MEEGNIKKVEDKRKNWTASGIDGIQNYWWQMFSATWRLMTRAMDAWVKDQMAIPDWIAIGWTVLLLKTEDLSCEKDSRSITCLNTSYKIFTGILEMCMKEHSERNEVWG